MPGQQFQRSFVGVTIVSGLAVAAVVLLYIFEVLDRSALVPVLVAVVVVDLLLITGVLVSHQRRLRSARESAEVDRSASTIDGTAPGGDVGYDPMKKYPSPNDRGDLR